MLQNTNNVKDDSEQIDFSYYFSVVLKHVWVLLGIICIGLFASILVNIFMQPVYKSSALMMIDREDSGKIDPTSFGAWSSDEDYYRTQYKLLESRSLLEKVYNDMNLDQYHEFKNPNGWFKLKNKINIVPITRSRLLNLEVKSYDKNLSATIANTIAKTFVADNINNRISMAKDVIAALETTERSPKQQELLNSMPQVVNSDFIKGLKEQEIDLYSQYVKFIAKYTKNHPDIISIQNQLDAIRTKIDIETKRLVQSIKIELSGQFSGNNIRIIDEAIVAQGPYKPNKIINLAIGLAGGFVFGLLIVFFLEFVDKSIKSSEDLKDKLKLPFLGFIPMDKNKKVKSEYEIMIKEGNFLMAEQVRNVRTMLNFALSDDRKAPILIASSVQGEGKSHLAVNLSVAISQTDKKVLLIDGDLRRSRLHKTFKLSIEKGLSNIWNADEEKSDFAYNIQSTDVENLFVMTSGMRPPNPSELLNTPLLEAFIKWALQNYDAVLVDCPAVLPVSDTLLWGGYINKAIFVVKYGQTNSKMAQNAIEKMQKVGIKILGGVIAQYQPKGLTYGKYGYYKSYNYYSSDNK
ncbi:MAG: polysaccharide biosynthesis tyrosine autokinase [Endomicrobiaceae bacterium]|nr:polysaccharide biosynthesis tyrosine autokinase [Endomicrobiaceae bacterium]MDD3922215.1 polysaccharide biosynthesis tyrosine autokinase [Endomicrobiaceae bacterium]